MLTLLVLWLGEWLAAQPTSVLGDAAPAMAQLVRNPVDESVALVGDRHLPRDLAADAGLAATWAWFGAGKLGSFVMHYQGKEP
jgi:hypothetical protein